MTGAAAMHCASAHAGPPCVRVKNDACISINGLITRKGHVVKFLNKFFYLNQVILFHPNNEYLLYAIKYQTDDAINTNRVLKLQNSNK